MVLHLKKHESLSSKDACAKIGWNWLNGSGEEDFLILSMFFRYFIFISPWKRAGPVESPSPKDALGQVWMKLAQWFWRRRWKCEKFTDGWTDRQTTDDRWSEKLTWAFSSGELKKIEKKFLVDIFRSENKHTRAMLISIKSAP